MSIKHHIRILHDTAVHAAHTVLGVSDNHAAVAAGSHLVHHDKAHELVKAGHAEWVGLFNGGAHPHHDESHEARGHRHTHEHAEMLSRHASEHAAMRDRHEAEHLAAIAALGAVATAAI